MTIDKAQLKTLAEAASKEREANQQMALKGVFFPSDIHISKMRLHAGQETILALLAEIERLEADNGSMRGSTKRMGEDASKAQKQARKAQREIDQLKAENEALRKDAGRYRWLIRRISKSQYYFLGAELTSNTESGIDDAIDSAMTKESK